MRRLLALGLATSLALALLECGTRALAPQTLVPAWLETNPDSAHPFRPGTSTTGGGGHAPYTFEVRINAQGFRMDAPLRTAPGVRRVVLVGDSFTLGWGVEAHESFATRLATPLEAAHSSLQLVNAGVGGQGTGHAMLGLRRFLDRFDACAALYFMNPNDLIDNAVTHIDYRVTQVERSRDGTLYVREVPRYSGWKRFALLHTPYGWLGQHSHAFTLAKRIASGQLSEELAQRPAYGVALDALETSPERSALLLSASLAHLGALDRLASQRRVALRVVWIPAWSELFEPDRPANDALARFRAQAGEALGSRFLDPLPRMLELTRDFERAAVYFPDGEPVGHFTPLGNQLFASAARAEIDRFVLAHCGRD